VRALRFVPPPPHPQAEYDVPRCAAGTPPSECTHTITGTWVPVPAKSSHSTTNESYHLVAAHAHCHAPTCMKVEMWNNDTGKLLCRQEPIYGLAAGGMHPGADNRSSTLGKHFAEPGYIATPVRACLRHVDRACVRGSTRYTASCRPPPLRCEPR
jgi:hypothetical protein